jgi:saccharopine dehydrogenase-like NADP-dependent oxidoreductase
MLPKRILLLGAFGPFGRRIAQALARLPDAECLLGAEPMNTAERLAREIGVRVVAVNPHEPESIRHALPGVFAVVNTCGPFLEPAYTVAEQCAEHGVHYVDPSDARDYLDGMQRLARTAERSGSLLVTAASAAPAVSAALVEMLRPEFDRVREIHTCLSPGARDQRELATMRAILSYADNPPRMKERGRWREFHYWSRPQTVAFPKPLGRRRAYLCDHPDLDLFPKRYGAQTVTFRIALPWRSFNLALAGVGWLRRHEVITQTPASLLTLARAGARLLPTRRLPGGIRVELRGERRGEELTHTAALLARDRHSAAISTAPILALVKQWLARGVAQPGVMPCVGLLSWDELKAELRDYDIVLVRS